MKFSTWISTVFSIGIVLFIIALSFFLSACDNSTDSSRIYGFQEEEEAGEYEH